ncbi:flagellar hook-associated protein FlgK [Methylobacterium sp. WL9]|uniref:flagellar hook-associated protein FlgK n=1 Tax=Methylobacterium sp. WL9 TaxID=2603898 RepID=UPI0011C9457E|nr:flagellar hook-associated protein FlgK [Methylobacterium sp. WL9]TXN24488.1 flagellar hook-associated protein FlgK [Methylobacterium sp. WL9]
MSINALNTATAGLRLTQAQIGIVSQNVANAGTVGYIKRTLDSVTTGPGNSGVATGTVGRTLDAAALKQLRLETSGAAYTALNAAVLTQVDKLYGTPGSSNALDGLVNGFASSLQTLAANPSASAARSGAVTAASSLAAKIGSVANSVQDLRTAMESQLSQDTAQAGTLLTSIADLNTRVQSAGDGASKADLLDRRDQAINALSALMDVQTVGQSDGSVSVFTTTGVTLVDRSNATKLSFDSRGTLSPNATYSTDSSKRGVGTITAVIPGGASIDLVASGAIRSGSIAAALEQRDTVLPQAQRQLDDLAAGLSRSMSDNLASGTAATDGTRSGFDIDLNGLSAGNGITLTVKDASGIQRNLILMPSYLTPPATAAASATDDSGATVVPFTIPASSASRDPATIVAAISTALGSSFRVSGAGGSTSGTVRILSNGGGSPTLLAASASVTQATSPTDTQSGSAQLALFVDSGRNNGLFTGSFDGGSQLTGFAQRIAVNPNVATTTATLVATSGTAASSDSTRPQALYTALTGTQRTFSSSSGIGGVNAPTTSTVSGFAQSIIASQGAAAASAQNLDEGQSVALATAQGRFSTQSGVNIDEEMSKLIELQTAYTANARVLTAARDMIDTLLRI